MSNIWLTSDLHLCHDREFIYKPRGFENVSDMNHAIASRWNERVKPEDDVYLLGDVMLNDNITGLGLLKSLNGKIHIIIGNHDTASRIELYKTCWNVVEVVLPSLQALSFLPYSLPLLDRQLGERKPAKVHLQLVRSYSPAH